MFLAVILSMCHMAAAAPVPADHIATAHGQVDVYPVNHASFVLAWEKQVIYFDPVGGAVLYRDLPKPTLIVYTDIHQDHFDAATLKALSPVAEIPMLAPKAVVDLLPSTYKQTVTTLANGEKTDVTGISIEALPMYNTTPERLQYHPKGRGNGYILTMGGSRIYVSGDTEDIPEMKALTQIKAAFLCMNLPYTMDVTQAAHAVKTFKPAIVYPYHSKGSDLQKFKQLVAQSTSTEVRILPWYPKASGQ